MCGATAAGWHNAPRASRCANRCWSTRCTWARGCVAMMGACSATARSRRGWRSMCAAWGSRTWSCFPCRSIRSVARGATRWAGTSRPPHASAHPTTSAIWWTRCTRRGSACCWTGCRRISPRMTGRCADSMARPATSTRIRGWAITPNGARTSSTTRGTRCATSSWRTRCTGSRSSTLTGCAWMRWRPCCISITAAKRGSGCATAMVAARTSMPWDSSSSSIMPCSRCTPA